MYKLLCRTTFSKRSCLRAMSSTPDLQRVCVVGSGPAGFYVAKYLLKDAPDVRVDMLEELPTPFGLVRSGVAPDHPEVKSVMNDFTQVATNDRFGFLGNVRVGRDVSLDELRKRYHGVVLAYGASGDKTLDIPGESSLQGVHSARAFVNWYNGHPSFRHLEPDLSKDTAVVLGQGNVAVDCARMLTKSTAELEKTDMTHHALDVLKHSNVNKVVLVGRRGSAQAAFTMKELRELTRLPDVACVVDPEDMKQSLTESSQEEIKTQRAKKRMNELLKKAAEAFATKDEMDKCVQIKFLSKPVEILPDEDDPTRVGGVRFERTRLEGPPDQQKAVGTNEFEDVKCGLVLRSIGYKSAGVDDAPFDDQRNVLSNVHGRVVDTQADKTPVPGLYCSGWVKRGPSGIIGSNIMDARETVGCIVEDMANDSLPTPEAEGGVQALQQLLKERTPDKRLVTWEDVGRLEKEEVRRGLQGGKPREKFVSVQDMLEFISKP